MKHKYLLLAFLCLLNPRLQAQNGLYISSTTDLFIGAGTVFSTDSLVIIPSSNFTISAPNALTKNTSTTHSTTSPYIQRVFHLSSMLSSYSGTVVIYYRDEELNGISENALTLNVHDGTSWNAYNTNVTKDATNNFVLTAGLSNVNLSELTLASFSPPLPFNYMLLAFFCTGNSVKLSWKTTQEYNTKNFDIERSADGRTWQSIGSLIAAGNSTTEQTYTWTDSQPITNGLYRVVEYNVDGRKTISSIIRPSCSPANDLVVVYPNPLYNTATINISINESATVTFRLYDAKGSLVKQSQTNLLQGTNLLQLDMTNVASGSYLLLAQWNHTIKSVKIIKR